jgi:hypothetical protein
MPPETPEAAALFPAREELVAEAEVDPALDDVERLAHAGLGQP